MLNPHTFTPTWPLQLLPSQLFSPSHLPHLLSPTPPGEVSWLTVQIWLIVCILSDGNEKQKVFRFKFHFDFPPPLFHFSFLLPPFFLDPDVTLRTLDSGIPSRVRNGSSADKIHRLGETVSSWGITPDEAPQSVQNLNVKQKSMLGISNQISMRKTVFQLFFGGVFSNIYLRSTSLIYAKQEMFRAPANRNPLKL